MEKALEIPHPYSPRDLHLPGYVPVLLPPSTIICVYIAASLLVMAFVWVISVSGLTHLILEGYHLSSPEFYKDASGFYLSEVWKEYSRSDSWDSTIVSNETIVVLVVGPACLLAVYAIATEKASGCMFQFAVSLVHLYGTALHFLTAYGGGSRCAYYVIERSLVGHTILDSDPLLEEGMCLVHYSRSEQGTIPLMPIMFRPPP